MTPPTDDIPWDRLTALLAGTLPPDEAARLEVWLAEDPTRQELVESLRVVWTSAAEGRPSWDAHTALDAIKKRAGERTKVLSLPPRFMLPSTRARALRPALIAAALVGICTGALWLSTGPLARQTAPPAALKQYETGRAQRLAFKLPDGSTVMLGPQSTLRYANTYGQRDRVVEIRGDAYFQVNHDAAHPFEVRAGNALVRDLGTRFVVRARDVNDPVDVVVAEGRVALGRAAVSRAPRANAPLGAARAPLADSLVLDGGDLGQVTARGTVSRERGVPLDRYFGWTEGQLVFRRTPLREAAAQLERWYDLDIRVASPDIGDRGVTGSFGDHEPAAQVLRAIGTALHLEVVETGPRTYSLRAAQ